MKINIENMKIALRYLEENKERIKKNFHMAAYEYEHAECGTTYCLAGHICLLAEFAPFYRSFHPDDIPYEEVTERILGVSPHENERVFDFLFSGAWSNTNENTLEHALARLRYVIENGQAPDVFSGVQLSQRNDPQSHLYEQYLQP
jgi:hypothetical protein